MSPQTVAVLGLALSLGLVVSGFPAEQPENGKHWVVIVAGSNGWYNYRHQVRKWKPKLVFGVKYRFFPKLLVTFQFSQKTCLQWIVFYLYVGVYRLMCAMRIRLSIRMEFLMSRLWWWCMMILLIVLSEYNLYYLSKMAGNQSCSSS